MKRRSRKSARVSHRRDRLQRQYFPLHGERLEDRRMLAAVVTSVSAGALGALTDFLDNFVEVDQVLPQEARSRLSSPIGSGGNLTYQAYQGEVNDVSVSQQFSDFFYLVNEGNGDVPVVNVPLAYNPEIINDLGVGFSFVVEVTADIGDVINLPDVTAIVPNAKSILEVIPGVGGDDGVLAEMTNLIGEGLTFGLGEIVSFIGEGVDFVQDALNTAVGPIVSAVGDVVGVVCDAIDAIPFVNPDCDSIGNFSEEVLGSLANNLNPLPDIPNALLEFGLSIIEGLTTVFTTESVVVSTLDGPDNVDLSTLDGVDQLIFAGSGADTILAGGGDGNIEVYGEGGRDKITLNFRFDAPRYKLDGGSGNDVLIVNGSDGNDTIRVVSNGGALQSISLEAPNPNAGGAPQNEQQVITLPQNVSAGDFTLSFGGFETAPINFLADGPAVETALLALPSLLPGDLTVAGQAGGPYQVTFGGAFDSVDVPMLASNGTGLTVGGNTLALPNSAINISTERDGNAALTRNEWQRLTLPSTATGGTYQLTFDGETTGPISYFATPGELEDALELLGNIGTGNVSVTGSATGPYEIEFIGALADADQRQLTATSSLFTSVIGVSTIQEPDPTRGTNEEQTITLPPLVDGGTFTLNFDGATTDPIPFDADNLQVLSALEDLTSVPSDSFDVRGVAGGPWTVEFQGSLSAADQPLIVADGSQLSSAVAATVSELQQASAATNEQQRITVPAGVTGGTYRLSFDGATTPPIPYDAQVAEVQSALQNLSTVISPANLVATQLAPGDFLVEFVNSFRGLDQSLITANNDDLRGGVAYASSENTTGSGTNEIQEITTNGATGGTFELLFNNGSFTRRTVPLPFDATPGEVQAALENLTSVGAGNVSVSGPVGGPWSVEFVADYAAQDQLPILVDGNGLDNNGGIGFVTIQDTQGGGGNDEVQIVELQPTGFLGGGTFTLSLDDGGGINIVTDPIPFDADGAAVDTALANAGLTGVNDVTVNGSPGGPYTISFTGSAVSDVDIAGEFEVDVSELRLGGTETQAAVPGNDEVQQIQFINVGSGLTAGDFTLEFDGETTPPLPFDATASDIQAALESLGTIGSGNVEVVETAVNTFEITFVGALSKLNIASLVIAETSNLSGPLELDTITTQAASAGVNEQQQIEFSTAPDAGGQFTLSFNGATTPPISVPASAGSVQAQLEALPTIGSGNIVVSGPTDGPWEIEFQNELRSRNQASIVVDTTPFSPNNAPQNLRTSGRTVDVVESVEASGQNELQRVSLPSGVASGTFRLNFDGEETAPINFDAPREDVQAALVGLSNIGANDVEVFGPPKGPYTIEFKGTYGETNVPRLIPIANFDIDGGTLGVEELVKGNDGGENVVLATTTFTDVISIEQLQIDTGNGDDTIIIEGETGIPSVLVEGGDGTDVLQLQSDAAAPQFTAPIFPDGTQATLQMDGQSVQFAGVEGGVVFDANGQAGQVSVSGTDEANDIRFQALGGGAASFANDGQVTINLSGFAAGSSVEILGQQGDDVISLATNGQNDFTEFTIAGGGPAGADLIRLEGTATNNPVTSGNDVFTYTPADGDTEAGNVQIDLGTSGTLEVNFTELSDIDFVGLSGSDRLTTREPSAGANDTVLFNPAAGNDGSFQFTSAGTTPGSTAVYPVVQFTSFENRIFDTGTGQDTLSISTDDLPGVNSDARVLPLAPNEVLATYGDQSVSFIYDTSDGFLDTLAFEIGTANDNVVVTPGQGLRIVINTALGDDRLQYNAGTGDVTVDIESSTITQPNFGPVQFTNTELVLVAGSNGALTLVGGPDENRFSYRPLGPQSGRVHTNQSPTTFAFQDIGGPLELVGESGPRDLVELIGTTGEDEILVDGNAELLQLTNAAGVALLPVSVANDIETVVVESGEGDDRIRVIPGSELAVEVRGASPQASDRLLIEDLGPGDLILQREASDGRSGSVTVGGLPPVSYDNVERVDILPLDPETGGTGADGLGRLVVLDADPFEHNQSLPNRTDFGNLFEISTNPNIDPQIFADAFENGPTLPGDEDWYRFDAARTDTLRFDLIFEPIGTLANGNPGLPGDGQLQIDVYGPDNQLIAKLAGEGPASHTVGVEQGKTYSLRVRGLTPEAVNNYDIRLSSLDEVGPQVTDLFITDDPTTPRDESEFDLFEVKPIQGPTPPITSLSIDIRDLSERFPGFLYGALDTDIAKAVGQYQLVGDHNGIIPIAGVEVINDPVVIGENATAKIRLLFDEPLPDDRFTLTVADNIVDPVGNQLDGESNADEPQGNPLLPSGDGVAAGDFVARFTVDTRAEIGVWAFGTAYIDTNGNNIFDAESQFSDATNEDIVYKLGFKTDSVFAGNFIFAPTGTADGFDKLAAYGSVAGAFRWLIDTNNNGVPDLVVSEPSAVNGKPVAGNFDGNAANGDEVALKSGEDWYFDTDHDFRIDTTITGNLVGLPVVGDFDGDGSDDLGAWADDVFMLDLSSDGIDAMADVTFRFGFPGVREIPVAADFNGDGVDDLGLWNPDGAGLAPSEQAEWYVLMSQVNRGPGMGTVQVDIDGQQEFETTAERQQFFSTTLVPVDPTLDYRLSAEARSGDDSGGNYDPGKRHFFGFASYDADQLRIDPWHILKHEPAVDTTLAVTLQPGDTTIQLSDATGWSNHGPGFERAFAWYGYSNSAGEVYPDYTYTRNVARDHSLGLWDKGAISGNTITLREPWSGPTVPAGTAVRNATAGPTYNYAALSRGVIPDQWTELSAEISGIGEEANNFRPGTAFIQPMAMTNYFGTTTNLVRFRDVEVALASTPVIPITQRIVSASDGPIGDTIDFTPIPFGPDVFANFGSTEAVPVVGNFDPPVVPIDGGVESTIQLTGITATNEENPLDVDGNGIVAPLDALAVVNFINRFGSEGYAAQTQIEVGSIQIDGGMRLDVNRDGLISPLDALAVINRLNQRGAEAEGEAESELFARWTESLLQPSTSAEVDFDLLLPPQQDALRPLDEAFANWDDDDEDEAALSMSMTWER